MEFKTFYYGHVRPFFDGERTENQEDFLKMIYEDTYSGSFRFVKDTFRGVPFTQQIENRRLEKEYEGVAVMNFLEEGLIPENIDNVRDYSLPKGRVLGLDHTGVDFLTNMPVFSFARTGPFHMTRKKDLQDRARTREHFRNIASSRAKRVLRR